MSPAQKNDGRYRLFWAVLITVFAATAFYRGWMMIGIVDSIAAVVFWIFFIIARREQGQVAGNARTEEVSDR